MTIANKRIAFKSTITLLIGEIVKIYSQLGDYADNAAIGKEAQTVCQNLSQLEDDLIDLLCEVDRYDDGLELEMIHRPVVRTLSSATADLAANDFERAWAISATSSFNSKLDDHTENLATIHLNPRFSLKPNPTPLQTSESD